VRSLWLSSREAAAHDLLFRNFITFYFLHVFLLSFKNVILIEL